MIADAVKNIGGERVEVSSLMGPGVDPHLYKASEGDVRRLSEADVILFNGIHLEAKMGEVLEAMNGRVKTVAVAEALTADRLLSPPGARGTHDPHVWFDVRRWMVAVEAVRDTFVEVDPAHAGEHRERAARYLNELRELDAFVRARLEQVPPDQRVLVTAHDAFSYFGDAYGFEVVGIQGLSTQAEAGTADVQRVARIIAERRIPTIFVESSVPRRAIEAVQAAVASQGPQVAIGGQLFSDALGDPGTPEGTYLGMVRHNVETIVAGLALAREVVRGGDGEEVER
jgi:manganese/zinc/iron transport system substrate-binding protein